MEIKELFLKQQENKYQMKSSSFSFRQRKLKHLREVILRDKKNIESALFEDFQRPFVESDLVELLPVISEINYVLSNLKSWMSEEPVKTPALHTGTKSWIRYEGKGNCLLIGPWNYPFHLIMYPLISAIAAGNTVMIKPSEFTPHINKVIMKMIREVFELDEVCVVEGGVETSNELLDLPFEHIFFTGSTRVGKIVMNKASQHLASVTLELGGKSPTIVDRKADLEEAALKIAWGKFVNAGQTCIAPDYLFVHQDVLVDFLEYFSKAIKKLGEEEKQNYCGIINEAHFKRLQQTLDEAVKLGAKLEIVGEMNESNLRMELSVLSQVPEESKLMQEEIFGPLLPIKTYKSEKEVVDYIRAHSHPLALYIFSKDDSFISRVLEQTTSGGVAINEVLLHNANLNLPFGGVGASGQGAYHGRWGFLEFSHKRAVLKRKVDLGIKYFYPPYNKSKKTFVDSLFSKLSRFF